MTVDASRDKRDPNSSNLAVGDPVEIWDVRRGWIAKWCVTGSATDGGVTGVPRTFFNSPFNPQVDICFGDSHAMWAIHSSGMFSQIDLRDAIKPLDSLSSTAVSWEAFGSVAFASKQKAEWELPYDDRQVVEQSR